MLLTTNLKHWVVRATNGAVDKVTDAVREFGGSERWIDWQAWALRERNADRRIRWRR